MNDKVRSLIIWSAAGIVILMIAALGWTLQRLPDANDIYGQWAAAELVISFHKQHHQLPARWEDLRPFYTDEGAPHRTKQNLEELRTTIDIDFARLAKLEQLANTESPPKALPEVIQPTSRNQAHWSGAEPNELVFDYLSKQNEPRWYPRLESVPSNALRFYLVFPEAMTTGDIFTHLQLIDTEKNTPIAGAFREVELWSPDSRRLTVWLHPGRQKTGVNLNEDEGPVLIEGHRYSLVLSRHATTARGTSLPADLTLEFNVGPPDHEAPHPSRWKVSAPKANTIEALRIDFDQPIDRGMAGSIVVDGGQAADLVQLDDRSMTWSFIPWRKWTTGQHFIEVSPDLEDMAGNNLIRPFEVEVSPASNPRATERKPVRIEFEVSP